MSWMIDLSKVKAACKFKLEVVEDGSGGVDDVILHGSCSVKDTEGKTHVLKREISLLHFIELLQEAYEGYTSRNVMSGPLSLTINHSGGWLSDTYAKTVKVAKKIGENRIAQDIYNDVLPEIAPFIPGGTTALSLVDKAHDIVVKAREGKADAIGKVKALAADPSSAAKQVIGIMKRMAQMMAMKQAYDRDRTVDHTGAIHFRFPWQGPAHKPYTGRRASNHPPPARRHGSGGGRPASGSGGRAQPGQRDHRQQPPPQASAWGQDPNWLPPGQGGVPPGYEGDPYYAQQNPYYGYNAYGMTPMPNMPAPSQEDYEDQEARAAYFESLFDPTSDNYVRPIGEDYYEPHGDEYVEGWLYNRPYRDPLTALQQVTKDPGTIHRFLYNRGMGRG